MRVVDSELEREVIKRALRRAGAADADAVDTQADWLTEGDLRGHPSHGIRRLPTLVGRIESGVLDPDSHGEATWRSASALEVDARGGFGPVVALAAIERLLPAARSHGVAVAAIRESNHLGLLSPYVERICEEGLVSLMLSSTEALVHPTGGRRALIGTNPIAIGVPADPDPFVLDMATSAVSKGKVLDHVERRQPLEPGWAVDERGEGTTDPDAASRGAISPFGGGKGYGLGLGLGLLVAALTGTALGDEVRGTLDRDRPSTKGDLIVVLDPSAFGNEGFVATVSSYLEELRDSPPGIGSDGVSVPGERSRRTRERGLREGVPVADPVWRQAVDLAGWDPAEEPA